MRHGHVVVIAGDGSGVGAGGGPVVAAAGGEMETSILLHTHPELVGDTYADADHEANNRQHLLVTGMKGYTTNGIIGRPSEATAAKGKAALDSLAASFADHLKTINE